MIITPQLPDNSRLLGLSGVAVTHTGNTNETVLGTVTIPANTLGPNGALEIRSLWSATNNANNKTSRIRLGGIGGTAFAFVVVPSNDTWPVFRIIVNRNATNSQICEAGASIGTSQVGAAGVVGSVDTTAALDLVFTGQLANGADTIGLQYYMVRLIRA